MGVSAVDARSCAWCYVGCGERLVTRDRREGKPAPLTLFFNRGSYRAPRSVVMDSSVVRSLRSDMIYR